MDKENEIEKEGYKLSFFQKAALAPLLKVIKKSGVTKIVLTPDETNEMGFKMDFFTSEVKILTVDEYNELKALIDL